MENYENPGKSEESLFIHGHPWITWKSIECPWIFLDSMDISMDIHGYPRVFTDIHENPWISMHIRISIDFHGYLWITMDADS